MDNTTYHSHFAALFVLVCDETAQALCSGSVAGDFLESGLAGSFLEQTAFAGSYVYLDLVGGSVGHLAGNYLVQTVPVFVSFLVHSDFAEMPLVWYYLAEGFQDLAVGSFLCQTVPVVESFLAERFLALVDSVKGSLG